LGCSVDLGMRHAFYGAAPIVAACFSSSIALVHCVETACSLAKGSGLVRSFVSGWRKVILSLRLGLRSDLPPQRARALAGDPGPVAAWKGLGWVVYGRVGNPPLPVICVSRGFGGGAEEGNFVAAAAPSLGPAAAWKGVGAGCLWAGWKPAPSSDLCEPWVWWWCGGREFCRCGCAFAPACGSVEGGWGGLFMGGLETRPFR
jgi:hypothetical protein